MRKLSLALIALAVLPLSACGTHHHRVVVHSHVVHVHGGGVVVHPRVCSNTLRRNRYGRLVRVKVCR